MPKLDRVGELSEIALRHSRPSARAGQLLPKVGKGLQKRKRSSEVQRARGGAEEQRRCPAAQKVNRWESLEGPPESPGC